MTIGKLILLILLLFCLHGFNLNGQNPNKSLIRAAKNTFTTGGIRYMTLYETIDSKGDTSKSKYLVTLVNRKNNISFNALKNDTIKEIHWDNLGLSGNLNKKTYSLRFVDQADVIDEYYALFPALLDKAFYEYFEGDPIKDTSIGEDEAYRYYRMDNFYEDDLDTFFFNVSVAKLNNKIIDLSINGSVAGIPIYERWHLVSLRKFKDLNDSLQANKNIFYKIIRTFKPYCQYTNFNSRQDQEVSFAELQKDLPSMNLISVDGDTMKLQTLKSKYFIVDFWFRSCLPCIKSMPILNEIHTKYSEDEVKIVSINYIDKSEALIKKFMTDNKLNYDVYYKSLEIDRNFRSVRSYPTFFIYDEHFNVVEIIEGYKENLLEKIEMVINRS